MRACWRCPEPWRPPFPGWWPIPVVTTRAGPGRRWAACDTPRKGGKAGTCGTHSEVRGTRAFEPTQLHTVLQQSAARAPEPPAPPPRPAGPGLFSQQPPLLCGFVACERAFHTRRRMRAPTRNVPAAVRDVALYAAREPHVVIRVHKHLHVEQGAHLCHGQHQDALHDHDVRGVHLLVPCSDVILFRVVVINTVLVGRPNGLSGRGVTSRRQAVHRCGSDAMRIPTSSHQRTCSGGTFLAPPASCLTPSPSSTQPPRPAQRVYHRTCDPTAPPCHTPPPPGRMCLPSVSPCSGGAWQSRRWESPRACPPAQARGTSGPPAKWGGGGDGRLRTARCR